MDMYKIPKIQLYTILIVINPCASTTFLNYFHENMNFAENPQ